jgi:hypothetical protein
VHYKGRQPDRAGSRDTDRGYSAGRETDGSREGESRVGLSGPCSPGLLERSRLKIELKFILLMIVFLWQRQ